MGAREEAEMKIVVLGAGMVGSAIVRDLAHEAHVTVIDLDQRALDRLAERVPCRGIRADLREMPDLDPYVSDCDLVMCAVPGFMGFETLEKVIRAGKDIVDISFFADDPFLLDGLAREQGVTAVVDCGVAPGLCNIIAGYVDARLDQTERYVCYVGGLPQVRERSRRAAVSLVRSREKHPRSSGWIAPSSS
jgi:saccharopine dehydrogenase-like NADP-dependent oxidoreductase